MDFKTKMTPINENNELDERQQNEVLRLRSSRSPSPVGMNTIDTTAYRATQTRTCFSTTNVTMKPAARRLSETDVRSIFDCLHHGAPTHMSFQVVPVGPNGLKLSPPSHDFSEGLYVLLQPPKKQNKRSKTSLVVGTDRQQHQDLPSSTIPPHLTSLVWKSILPENCPWSLSGPQLKNSFIQQRYCYPKGRMEFGSQKGGALWTLYGADGKEDLKYRLLHVYFSPKRVNIGDTPEWPNRSTTAVPVSPTPSMLPFTGEDGNVSLESRSTPLPNKRAKRSVHGKPTLRQPSTAEEKETVFPPMARTSPTVPSRRLRPPSMTLSLATGGHESNSNNNLSDWLTFSPVSSSSSTFFATPTREQEVEESSDCKNCGLKQPGETNVRESRRNKLSLQTAATPLGEFDCWQSPFSYETDNDEVPGLRSPPLLPTSLHIDGASVCVNAGVESPNDEKTATSMCPLDLASMADLESCWNDLTWSTKFASNDYDEKAIDLDMQTVGTFSDVDSLCSIEAAHVDDWIDSDGIDEVTRIMFTGFEENISNSTP